MIDFDDSVYSWYAMDVDQSLDDLPDDLPDDQKVRYETAFLDGYRAVKPMSDDQLYYRPVFRRFVNLYGYVRILRSLHETWQNEPEWMIGLRNHVSDLMLERAATFGQKLQ